ncbi:hypothetical protein IG631_01493 [Alternaria alternata]|nr:hypothetical protein IG631_01493 [Alternaria alternata]
MNPTNVAVIICSAIVGLIRLYVACLNFTKYFPVMDGIFGKGNVDYWGVPVILATLTDLAPFFSCMISIAVASSGHTAWGLQVQLATFSLLSICDLVRTPCTMIVNMFNRWIQIGGKLWWTRLPVLRLWQKISVYAAGTLTFGGTVAATCLPTPYTTFVSSLVFLITYTYLTHQFWNWPRRWLPYLVFTLLLLGAAIALGILVFGYKKPQQSEYLFLVRCRDSICNVANTIKALNLLHPRTIYGFQSVFRNPLGSAVNKNPPQALPPTSASALNRTTSQPNSITKLLSPFEDTSKERTTSPYHHRGEQGKGFVSEDV